MRRLALGVVLGVVLVACSGDSSTSSVSILVDTDAMADYLADVLESESNAGLQDALMAVSTAVGTEQLVAASRQSADAFERQLQILELLAPPPEAAANHRELLDLTGQGQALYTNLAEAMEEGDRSELDRLFTTLFSGIPAEQANILERDALIGEVLSEKSDPLSVFMSAAISIRVTMGEDFQELFTELLTTLNTGGINEESYALLEKISADMSTAWSELTPPEEATAFHNMQANVFESTMDVLTPMKEAYANEDPAAIEQVSRQISINRQLGTQVENLESELLVIALRR